MLASGVEYEDIETLAQILEREKVMHRRRCALCFAMFVFAFCALVVALVVVGVHLASVLGWTAFSVPVAEFALFQVPAMLAGVAMLFFSSWWAAQNCVNTIERTLCAARNGRLKLFQTFLGEIQCAEEKKRRAWLEILKGAVM